MVNGAFAGDRVRTLAWVHDVVAAPDCTAMLSVLAAVCDAIVAEAFREKKDVARISNFINAFEHDVYAEFAAQREKKDLNAMNDSDTAQLAAGLVRVVQMHDRDTAVHLDATGALARRIAVAMELPPEQVITIELAARLHDIGKVGVRKEVLCKPSALTDDEWQEMRLHAEVGASVLLDTPKLAHLAPIVRAHHERMDGMGYPDRLRTAEIPLEARVIAVADAFHAMTTERSYRRAMLPNEALEILAEHAGTQFDTDVVEATIEMFRYIRRSLRAIA
jgi:HD-GYP domain-containing protein (c-di-GMP phosphodiesterase class II)